ncbi:unnamed protein product [Zymoseptoria tritici ST99CH_1A5]|uniref:Uncharacterized protein n=1 Tax=Zymoseptoria tritici ST99CH_1A5 TaxID=1276529 RepID=A0A1Y6M1S6_ZYMTR|nr:unnamed protein product [Zymoseptoria tritici ST99CH_1A5]
MVETSPVAVPTTEEAVPTVVKGKKKTTTKPSRKAQHSLFEDYYYTPPPDTPQPSESAAPPTKGPPTRQPSPSSPQRRTSSWYSCGRCFGLLSAAIIAIIAILLGFWLGVTPSQASYLPYQPVDAVVNATHITTSALELLADTASWHRDAKLAACRIVEASADVSQYPLQYAAFRKAWEVGGSGWKCPNPE